MTGDRVCPTRCGWAVPAYVPGYLVTAAMGDHRANDCAPDPAGPPGEVAGRSPGSVLGAAASARGEVLS